MIKKILPLLLAVCLLPSCQEKKSYRDDRSCEELIAIAIEKAPTEFGYDIFEKENLPFPLEKSEDADGFCIAYSIEAENINEIGVFHSPDKESAEELAEECEEYLEELREEKSTFIASYAAEELPKLERAEVYRLGNYTVYLIASDSDRKAIREALQAELLP